MTPVLKILKGRITVTVKEPNVINYIKHMSGVDHADQDTSIYCFSRKYLKL